MILGATMIATCEAFALAERLGLDAQAFYDIASVSSGQSWSMTSYCPVPGVGPASPADRDYQGGFAAALMLKDLRLAMEAARSVGASTPIGEQAERLYARFVEDARRPRISPGSSPRCVDRRRVEEKRETYARYMPLPGIDLDLLRDVRLIAHP